MMKNYLIKEKYYILYIMDKNIIIIKIAIRLLV